MNRFFVANLVSVLLQASNGWVKTSDVTPTGFLATFHHDLDATSEQAWQALVRLVGGGAGSEHRRHGSPVGGEGRG